MEDTTRIVIEIKNDHGDGSGTILNRFSGDVLVDNVDTLIDHIEGLMLTFRTPNSEKDEDDF